MSMGQIKNADHKSAFFLFIKKKECPVFVVPEGEKIFPEVFSADFVCLN